METRDVKKLFESIEFLKNQVLEMRKDVKEIKKELEFSQKDVRKFEELMERGKFKTFSSAEELRKAVEQ